MQKDFLNDTLYPALFERLNTALPEFHFREKTRGDGSRIWVSATSHRPDGSTGSEAGKTAVSERSPFFLSDFNPVMGRSIWAYLKERDGLDNAGVFRLLCELANTTPEANLSPAALARMEEAQRRAEVFEAANAYLLEQLHTAKSAAANAAREYLKGRGITLPELRQPEQELKDGYTGGERMELGYLPNLPDFERYLREQTRAVKTTDENGAETETQEARFTPEEIKKVLPPNGAAGRVSLTLRERGRIVSFKFRAVDDSKAKYLNLEGYQKEAHLIGLTRGEHVVFVEGELDAMRAHAAGFLEVAAVGGSDISERQIEAALRAGARYLTLAFDADEPGQTATRKAVENLLRYHEKTDKEFGVFVCAYPEGCKDFDELLRLPGGKEKAKEMLRLRSGVSHYLSNWLDTVRTEEIAQTAGGYSTAVFREELLREVVLLERLIRPVDVPQLRQFLEPLYKTYGIDAEAVAAAADNVRELEAAKRYRAELRDITKQAGAALEEGKTAEAENLFWNATREARLRLHTGRFAELLEGQTREAVAVGLTRGGLETSYKLQYKGSEEALELPAGAVSVFAAPSGHGKTAFLINLVLDLCQRYPEQEFHFFTLEESAAAVSAKMLNTFLDMDFSGRNEKALEAYLKGDAQFVRREKLAEMKEKEPGFWALLGKQFFVHYLEDSTAEQLCEAVYWLHKRRNVGAVFCDYIQLLNLENPGRLSRQEEVKAICLRLKSTAVDTDLPFVFAAQFSRQAKVESDTHDYTNIGEAGDIERVAALIVGLWNRTFTKENENGKGGGPEDIVAAKILKWRGGPVGYSAAWNWNGNRKRIYPGPLAPQSQAQTTGGTFSEKPPF